MNCRQCGQEIPDGLNFCIFCGTPVDPAQSQPGNTPAHDNPMPEAPIQGTPMQDNNMQANPMPDNNMQAPVQPDAQQPWQPEPMQPAQPGPQQGGYQPDGFNGGQYGPQQGMPYDQQQGMPYDQQPQPDMNQPYGPAQGQAPGQAPYGGNQQMPYAMPQQGYDNTQPYAGVEMAPKKKSWVAVLVISIVVLLIFGGIGGWYYYENVYLPELRDREAPRAYAITDVVMRNTRMSGVEYNRVGSIPYSAELIVYENDGQWARAKYKSSVPGVEPIEGYVASQYLIDREDMLLLNSIYADNNARMAVNTAKCKRALLEFYKANGLVGNIDSSVPGAEYLPTATRENHWVLQVNDASRKPSEVAFPRLRNSSSKYTDFAAILTNPDTGDRHYVYFYFDDDETPHLWQDGPAYGRYISAVTRDSYDYNRLNLYFTD